jgi:hypothetical protein
MHMTIAPSFLNSTPHDMDTPAAYRFMHELMLGYSNQVQSNQVGYFYPPPTHEDKQH